ncbi:MAG TPA: YfhO family protein, partial [Acidimicrobiia bacterium]|nr:YfhO family protein [Acidimicrobiia bacterium]
MWLLKLAVTPGAYLGAALLIVVFLAFRSRRHVHLAVAFSVYALVFFIAGLDVVARNVGDLIDGVPVLGLYAHFPGRLGLALLLALPILGALGLEAWRENGRGRDLAWAGLAVVAVWVAVPLALGVRAPAFALVAMGAAVAVPSLLIVLRRSGLLAVIPAIAAVELAVNGVGGLSEHGFLGSRFQAPPEAESPDPLGAVEAGWLVPLRTADVDPVRYEAAGTIARALQQSGDGRYASLAPEVASGRGYLTALAPADWPLLASQRSMLFGANDVQGYNPVQLGRYWAFVRAVSPVRLEYNAAVLPRPPPVAFDLLQIAFVVQAADTPRVPRLEQVTREGRWGLFEVSGSRPGASAISSWSVVSDPRDALSSVTAPGFDPSRQVLLEVDPGMDPPPPLASMPAGTASYRRLNAQSATLNVNTPSPAIVLVRTPHDPNWRATVDGRPVPVLTADFLVQGIPVPPGRHRIELTYDDPWVGYGLFGSGTALAILL